MLDRDTWEAVTAMFAARRRGRPTSYLLSSLIFCGRCGHGLTGQPRAGCYPDGERHRTYFCHRCKGVAIDMRFADATVEAAVKTRLADPRHAEHLARQDEAARDERERIRADIARAEQTRTRLADRLGRGEIIDEMFDTANAALRARLTRLHEQLAEVETPAPLSAVAAADVEREWDEGNLHDRRALVRRAFPKLTILPATGRGRSAISADRFAWDGVG
ncbi:MAG TPA: zinc ribbon domain-containing protein [Mycobacteriales bacterium]|nr:zinc ribbon domain-containing protein [Mycobacteriales bacterium]